MIRLDGYVRVSRVNGRSGDSFISPEQQRDQIEAFARVMGAEVVTWHTDLDESGGSTDRPGLNAAMARIEAGETGGLIVAKIDRFARAVEAYSIVRRILDAGAIFASAAERLDPTTPMGKAMLQIVLVFGELELDRFRDNWADSQARATGRGVWIGPAPLGYRRTKQGTLEPDRHAPAVTEAFRVAARDGIHAAGDLLTERLPRQRWRKSDVRRVLAKRAYLGEHHADGPGHEPLTTAAIFEAAQTEPRARRSSGDYPLSHVATCGRCGSGLVGALQTVGARSYRRMRCSNPDCRGGCSIRAEKLEGHVLARVRARIGRRGFGLAWGSGDADDAAAALERAEAERLRFAQDTEARELLGDEAWRAGLRAHADKATAARERLQAIAGEAARSEQLPGADELDDPEQLARAVRAGVARIVVAPGRGDVAERVVVEFVGDHLDDDAGQLSA